MSAALAMPAVRREKIDKYVLESGTGDVYHSSCGVLDLSATVKDGTNTVALRASVGRNSTHASRSNK